MAKKVAAPEVPAKKAAKKAAAPQTLGTKEVAAKLGVDPKTLRATLRAMGEGSEHKRYSWDADADLGELKEAIETFKAEKKAKREKAAAKAAPKKAKKEEAAAPAKKAKKKAKPEPVEDEEEEESGDELE